MVCYHVDAAHIAQLTPTIHTNHYPTGSHLQRNPAAPRRECTVPLLEPLLLIPPLHTHPALSAPPIHHYLHQHVPLAPYTVKRVPPWRIRHQAMHTLCAWTGGSTGPCSWKAWHHRQRQSKAASLQQCSPDPSAGWCRQVRAVWSPHGMGIMLVEET